MTVPFGLLDHFAQPHDLPHLVGHFDAHGVLAGNRRHDANAGHAQGDRQVVGQAGDLGQPQAGFQFDFVLRDDGSGFDFDDLHVEAKIGERLFQDLGLAPDLARLPLEVDFVAFFEQIDGGQFVVVDFLGQVGAVQAVHDLLPLVAGRRTGGAFLRPANDPRALVGFGLVGGLVGLRVAVLLVLIGVFGVLVVVLFVGLLVVFILVVFVCRGVLGRRPLDRAAADHDARLVRLLVVVLVVVFVGLFPVDAFAGVLFRQAFLVLLALKPSGSAAAWGQQASGSVPAALPPRASPNMAITAKAPAPRHQPAST